MYMFSWTPRIAANVAQDSRTKPLDSWTPQQAAVSQRHINRSYQTTQYIITVVLEGQSGPFDTTRFDTTRFVFPQAIL